MAKIYFSVLSDLRKHEEIVDYTKTEGDEFLQVKEKGYYLHSKNGNGKIFDCRIYFKADNEYYPASDAIKGKFANIKTFKDLNSHIGKPAREIKPLKIPGRQPTLPGNQYVDEPYIVSAFSRDGENINYLYIKENV